jgi:RimJ/RimL family protein N-acetyltransferase
MGLREIELDVHPGNTPAIRAYLAVGFEHARGTTMRLRRPPAEQPRAAVGE